MATLSRSVVASDPATEPLKLSEAKKQLEIAANDSTHDTHVRGLIQAARQLWEHDVQALTVSRSVVETINCWPDSRYRLYYGPISAIASITYYDADNVQQTLADTVYALDADTRKIWLKVDQEYPDIQERFDAIAITYTVGQTLVDEISKQAMKLQLSIMFDDSFNDRDANNWRRSYESLVERYQRGSYP